MSKVADFLYDIETLYIDGLTAAQIAAELNCPIKLVREALDSFGVADSPQPENDLVDF